MCFKIGQELKLDKIVKIGNMRLKKQTIEKKIVSDNRNPKILYEYYEQPY